MNRIVNNAFAELIGEALDRLPTGIGNRLRGTHFFTGTSPIYAGLIEYTEASLGRSFHTVWCCATPDNLTMLSKIRRQPTIIMPVFNDGRPLWVLPMIVLHELGHVLDWMLGESHIAEPITKYALMDRGEAFAEAFTLWLNPGYSLYYELIRDEGVDMETLNLFRELEKLWR